MDEEEVTESLCLPRRSICIICSQPRSLATRLALKPLLNLRTWALAALSIRNPRFSPSLERPVAG